MDEEMIDKALKRAGLDIPPALQDGEFTLAMFIKAKKISLNYGRRLIDDAVEAGVFEAVGLRRIPHVGTHPREAYRVKP